PVFRNRGRRYRASGLRMDIDDEDPAWLEACMAVVDSLPAANLQSTSSNQGTTTAVLAPAIAAVGSNRNGGLRSHEGGGGSRTSAAAAGVAPSSRGSRSTSHVAPRNSAGVAPFGTGGGAAGATSTAAGCHRSNSSSSANSSAGPRAPPSWANGGRHRMR
ncbi:unnamed protein product, partial [Ectocarpus fasciculatus]